MHVSSKCFIVILYRNTVDGDPRWCCTYLLDPSDPLFVEIGEAFIRKQIKGMPFFFSFLVNDLAENCESEWWPKLFVLDFLFFVLNIYVNFTWFLYFSFYRIWRCNGHLQLVDSLILHAIFFIFLENLVANWWSILSIYQSIFL